MFCSNFGDVWYVRGVSKCELILTVVGRGKSQCCSCVPGPGHRLDFQLNLTGKVSCLRVRDVTLNNF